MKIVPSAVILVDEEVRESEQEVQNYKKLLADQEPLGAEFEKVLNENLWDLYES